MPAIGSAGLAHRELLGQQQGQSGGNAVSPKEIDYGYNALGQFTTVTDFSTLSGPRTDVATGNSSYDADDRLIGLSYTSNGGATTIDAFGWSYNAGNLVTSFTSADGTASYGYDPTNQLTSASYTTATGGHQPANESYSFDANGNRNSTGYSTGGDNLITSDGTFNYTHDADGNTISRTRISSSYASDYLTTYTWDYRNRLTDVEYYDNNSVLTKHVFNGLIGEEDDDTGSGSYNHIERYIMEGGHPVLQFDGGGSLVVRYFGPVAQEQVTSLTVGGTVYWMATDNEGSVRDVVDSSGNPVDHIVYTAFGQTAYESNSAIAHWASYAGEHLSAGASLILSGARWYDSSTGRWLSNDPSGFAGHDANLSRYVGNDPINGIDPSGRFAQTPGMGVPLLSDYFYYLANPSQMDPGLQTAQNYALHMSLYAALGAFALGGVAAVGISQVGVVPLEFIPTQLGIEYATYIGGAGVAGASSGNCFVAGTQVIVPSRSSVVTDSPPFAEAIAGAECHTSVMGSLVLVAVGLAGYSVATRKRGGLEGRRREAALLSMFGDGDDTQSHSHDGERPMTSKDKQSDYERAINALCDALFHDGDFMDAQSAVAEQELVAASACGVATTAIATRARRRTTTRYAPPSGWLCKNGPTRRAAPPASAPRRRMGTIWLVACLALASWLAVRPQAAPSQSSTGSRGAARTYASSAKIAPSTTQPIEAIRVGQRVLGENPDLAEGCHGNQTAVDPATWRLIRLRADNRSDDDTVDTVEVKTLQPLDWLAKHGARVGALVPLPLDLLEMGMQEGLRATVVAVDACPAISDGPGHVVLTTVSHLNSFICELSVEDSAGQRETIKPTGYHKFYSDTREAWVSASKLRQGERLRGVDGPLTVADIRRVAGVERVYNMTVEGQHVYQVSGLGVLVHNDGCLPPIGSFGGDGTSLTTAQTQAQFSGLAAQEQALFNQMSQAIQSGTNAEAQLAFQQYLIWWDAYKAWFLGSLN